MKIILTILISILLLTTAFGQDNSAKTDKEILVELNQIFRDAGNHFSSSVGSVSTKESFGTTYQVNKPYFQTDGLVANIVVRTGAKQTEYTLEGSGGSAIRVYEIVKAELQRISKGYVLTTTASGKLDEFFVDGKKIVRLSKNGQSVSLSFYANTPAWEKINDYLDKNPTSSSKTSTYLETYMDEIISEINTKKDVSEPVNNKPGDSGNSTNPGQCISGDCKNGFGEFKTSDGTIYKGNFTNSKLEGKGQYTEADGTKYIGDFKNDKFEGKGEITLPDGAKYVGDFKKDQFEGKGEFTDATGTYVGDFKNDKFEGKGTLTNTTGTYVGDFKNGEKEGKGEYTFKSGGKYVGDFRNGQPEGKGTLTAPNGNKYIGDFIKGLQDGKGLLISPDGTMQSGNWVAGKRVD